MKKVNLNQFITELIIQLRKEQRDGTAHVYQSTLNRINLFTGENLMTFGQLTSQWLARFEKFLLADQLTWNTISTYMRMLRSIYNQAVSQGVASYVPHLFSKVHTGVDSPVKRAVSPETMRRVMLDECLLSQKQTFGRDMFVLLFLFRGMPFVDLAFLRKCDLQGNTITYHRRKTGRRLTVVVGSEAMKIIYKYMHHDENSPYLFPIIREPGVREHQQYTCMLRNVNYQLSRLVSKMKLKEALSTYVARHTWATTALRQNYNSSLICDAMGHSSVKVTETYFQRFKEEEVDRMNRSIVSFILSGSGRR